MSSDSSDYGFEYESDSGDGDGSEDNAAIEVENTYYRSRAEEEDSLDAALAGYAQVLELDTEKGEWSYKALADIVRIRFKLKSYDTLITDYDRLLDMSSAVTRNQVEESITALLDVAGKCDDADVLETFYSKTLTALEEANNERLCFKTMLRMGKLWYDREDYPKVAKVVKKLHAACESDGQPDVKKGTQLLEVHALEIQLYTATKNTKKLKTLYQRSLSINSAIPHPKVMGVIRECGGKMHMHEREWAKAHQDFFEAFKSYDEAGDARKIACLKYVLLANMLMLSDIDPFDSAEAKPHKNHAEIQAIRNLVGAYRRNDVDEFERVLRRNRRMVDSDPFMSMYIGDLLKTVRTQVLLKLIIPYTRVSITSLAGRINVAPREVEDLLVGLILDGRITGRIDQVNQWLLLGRYSTGASGSGASAANAQKYSAIESFARTLSRVNTTLMNKLDGPSLRSGGGGGDPFGDGDPEAHGGGAGRRRGRRSAVGKKRKLNVMDEAQ